jgi:GT2 family glycosyltransferase
MIDPPAWARVGPLDTRYDMFYDHVDWSLRARVTS